MLSAGEVNPSEVYGASSANDPIGHHLRAQSHMDEQYVKFSHSLVPVLQT